MSKQSYIFIGACYIQIITLFTVSIYKTAFQAHKHQHSGCTEIIGNPDMYGLGIRVGVYLQLCVTSFVDTIGNKTLSAGLIPANFWFLFALIIALGTMLTSPEAYAAEIYIVISLGNAIMLMVAGKSVKEESVFLISDGFLVSFSRSLLSGLWRALSAAYWFSVIDKTLQGSCTSYGWIFFKVELFGKFRTYNNVMNVIGLIFAAMSLWAHLRIAVVFCWVLWRKVDRVKWRERRVSRWVIVVDYLFVPMRVLQTMIDGELARIHLDDLPNEQVIAAIQAARDTRILAHLRRHYGDDEDPPDPPRNRDDNDSETSQDLTFLSLVKTHKLLFMILWDISNILFAVLNVEYALVFNNVTGVYEMKSAGQFIAFIIGVGGVFAALSEVYVDMRTKKLKEGHPAESVIWPTVMVMKLLKMNEIKPVEVLQEGEEGQRRRGV